MRYPLCHEGTKTKLFQQDGVTMLLNGLYLRDGRFLMLGVITLGYNKDYRYLSHLVCWDNNFQLATYVLQKRIFLLFIRS